MTQYRMRKWTLWLLFCTACAELAAGPRWDRQRIEHSADIQEHEFTAVFRFTNTAEQAIEITRIQSGCGCTVAEPDRWHYEPGESGEIRAQFVYGDRSGPQNMQIVVHMRAGQEALPPSVLEMAVVIPLLAEFDRRLLMWVRHSDPVAQIITLTLNDHAGVRLEKVQPDDPSFAVDIQPVPQRSGVTR